MQRYYFRQGLKVIVISGRIQTGSYTNKDGREGIYNRCCSRRTGICREQSCERCQCGKFPCCSITGAPASDAGDGFMNIPDGIDEELPFN